jgi:hypothetical protein
MMRPLLLTLGLFLTACGGRVVLGDEPITVTNEPITDAGDPNVDATPRDTGAPAPTEDAADDATNEAGGCTGDACFSADVCSLVGGTWDVTYNVFYGTDASFQFESDGTFIGGPRSAALPAGAIYSGQWALNVGYGWGDDAGIDDAGVEDAGTEVTVSNTTGMQCDSSAQTNMSLIFGPQCTTATLDVETDGCTGSRLYFDATTILTRR